MAIFKVILSNGIEKYHDDNSPIDVLNYIFDPRKTTPSLTGGISKSAICAAEQINAVEDLYHKNTGVRIRHTIISFDPCEEVSCKWAYIFGQAAIAYYSENFQMVFAVHTDHESPHIHMVMGMTNYITGKKYDGSTRDYWGFVNYMNGVFATAAPKLGHRIYLICDNK